MIQPTRPVLPARQRGNTLVGIVIGLVLGLGAALAVAVYVTKVPLPFMNKNQPRTPEQDAAESRKNQNWDPNAPLYGKNPAGRPAAEGAEAGASAPAPAAPASAAVASAPAPVAPPPVFNPGAAASAPRAGADPLGDLAAQRAAAAPRAASAPVDPFLYFVQAGAFRSAEEAEALRAKLSLMGLEARVSEREQSGRQVFRVRLGPFDRKDDADRGKARLDASGIEAVLVRVQR